MSEGRPKTIHEMSWRDFEALPERKEWNEDVVCKSLVIMPLGRMHDSGFHCMDFVAVGEGDIPICRLSGCSDVLHLDGIGGMRMGGEPRKRQQPTDWSIDCLKKSRLLRLWCHGRIVARGALSSFEIISEDLP